MDPDANLEEQLELAASITKELDKEGDVVFAPVVTDADRALRLCELVTSMNEWIAKGSFLPEQWAARCQGGLLKRAALAVRVYDEVFDQSEAFEGELGVQLSYLLGAILKGEQIALDRGIVEQDEVIQFFEILFAPDHPVWAHVLLE